MLLAHALLLVVLPALFSHAAPLPSLSDGWFLLEAFNGRV